MTARRALLAIVALAVIVRVVVVFATSSFVPQTDAVDFDRNAVSLATDGNYATSALTAHGGPTAIRPPLFTAALAAVYKVVGVNPAKTRWRAARLIEAVFGTVAVLLICLIGIRLLGPVAGLLAGAIAAVYPPLILIGTSLLSESLFIPLLLGAVWAALMHRDSVHRLRWPLLSGALLGLSALTRGNGIAVLIALGFLVWDARGGWSWRALRAPLAMVAATAVVLVPWTIRNYDVFGRLVPVTTEFGYTVAGTYNPLAQGRHDYPALWIPPLVDMVPYFRQRPGANEAQVSGKMLSDGLSYISDHPGSLLRTAYWTFLRLFNFQGPGFEHYAAPFEAYPPALAEISVFAFWVVLALAIAGAFTHAVRAVPKAVWGCAAVILLSCLLLEGSTRYRSPADPFFVLAAAPAVLAGWRRWRARRGDRLEPRSVPSATG
jgi:4-amino-4-deoxy-L-arabinose transferase-like glycosyltransferase